MGNAPSSVPVGTSVSSTSATMGNAPSSVPVGTSINLVNATLSCTSVYAGNPNNTQSVNIPFTFSVTAPLHVNQTGGLTYYYDIAAAFTLPSYVTSVSGEYGGTYHTDTTAVLSIGNANPNNFTIQVSQNKTFTDLVNTLPADKTKVYGALGPVRPYLADGQQSIDLTLNSLKIVLQYLNSQGGPIDATTTFSCPVSQNPYVLATSFADTAPVTPITAGNGFTANFPPTNKGQKSTIINTPINCNGNGNYKYIYGGTGPAVVLGTSAFSLTNFQTYFIVPGDVIQGKTTKYGPDTYRITLTSGKNTTGGDLFPGIGARLNGVATGINNVNYKDVDVSRDFTPTDSITDRPLHVARNVGYNTTTPVTFPLPLTGSLSYSVNPSGNGGGFSIGINSFQGSLISQASDGASFPDTDLKCTTPGYSILQTIVFVG